MNFSTNPLIYKIYFTVCNKRGEAVNNNMATIAVKIVAGNI